MLGHSYNSGTSGVSDCREVITDGRRVSDGGVSQRMCSVHGVKKHSDLELLDNETSVKAQLGFNLSRKKT